MPTTHTCSECQKPITSPKGPDWYNPPEPDRQQPTICNDCCWQILMHQLRPWVSETSQKLVDDAGGDWNGFALGCRRIAPKPGCP